MDSKFKGILIVIALFLISVIPSVSAVEDLDYVFKISDPIMDINRPCFNEGINGWCSAAAVCSLTVTDPDNDIIVLGSNMTNKISTHNITLPQLNKTGVYKADMACSDSNLTGYDTFFFGVNQAGSDYNKNSSVYFLLGILILLLIIFSLAAFFMEESLKLVFLLLAVLMLPVILWVSLDVARNAFMGAAVTNVLSTGFIVSLFCFGGMVFYVMITLLSQLHINKSNNAQQIAEQSGSPLYWRKKKEYQARKRPEEE